VKSTFFINGNNYVDASQAPYPDIFRRMVAEGHQIASHTYQHQDLNALDTAGRQSQMTLNEQMFANILGYFPTYMRPPYGNCNGACLADMAALGYHVITWSIDTLDYQNDSPSAIITSENIFDSSVSGNAGGNAYISLEHDVHQYTVQVLAAHIIQTAQSRGYRTVTVGECLGDPSGNWYRDATTGNAVGGSTGGGGGGTGGGTGGGGGLAVSTDATCAANSGGRFTCQGSSFGNCCSQYGWW
jgi:peptidoglycan/xylan/chitin deacetylase (PgdA/CDA1 family)